MTRSLNQRSPYELAQDVVAHSLQGGINPEVFGPAMTQAFSHAMFEPAEVGMRTVVQAIAAVIDWYRIHELPQSGLLLGVPIQSGADFDERVRLAAGVFKAQAMLGIKPGAGVAGELWDPANTLTQSR